MTSPAATRAARAVASEVAYSLASIPHTLGSGDDDGADPGEGSAPCAAGWVSP